MCGVVAPRHRDRVSAVVWSSGDYVHPVPRLISQAKDHRRWDAINVLGARLAFSVAGLIDAVGCAGPGWLVPVPSTPAAVRRRGLDFTAALAGVAARHLRRVGVTVGVRPLLTHRRRVADQGGLSSQDRHANLDGAMKAKLRPMAGWLVVVDDVMTTGASLAEATAALARSGLSSAGAATVAATVLRHHR
jgi:predicted amidophosphoribosyltransferase